MGDGISDLVIRGEGSEEAERDYVLSRIRSADDQVWTIHIRSLNYLNLVRTIRALERERALIVYRHRDWLHIKEQA